MPANDIVQRFLSELESYLTSRVNFEEMEHVESMIFGLTNITASENPQIMKLSPIEKNSLIESYRALSFLSDFDFFDFYPSSASCWPPEAGLQIKVYSLKSHIEKLTLDEEATKLFNNFFKEVLPAFPSDIEADILGNFDVDTTIGSYWYNTYLFDTCKKIINQELAPTMTELTNDNWKQKLNALLQLTSDPIAQFMIIELMWDLFGQSHQYLNENFVESYFVNENFVKSFFEVLSNNAKSGMNAASAWIVTAARHGKFLLNGTDKKISAPYSQFTIKDLLFFIKESCYQPNNAHITSHISSFFESLLEYKLSNINEDEMKYIISHLRNRNVQINSVLSSLQIKLIKTVEGKNPKFVSLLKLIKFEIINFFEALIADQNINPILRNLDEFKLPDEYAEFKNSPEYANVRDELSYAEIRKNARLIAQAARTPGPNFFKALPLELQVKISALTSNPQAHNEAESRNIAFQNLRRPSLY